MPVLKLAAAALLIGALPSPGLEGPAGPITVGGRLLAGGRPQAGVTAELLPEAAGLEAVRGTTGQDGVFRLLAPQPGLWRVRIGAPGSAVWEHPLHPLLNDTWLAPLELRSEAVDEGRPPAAAGLSSSSSWVRTGALHSPARSSASGLRVSGQALDANDGHPLAGAWIWPAAAPKLAVRADAGGRFNLPSLGPFVAALRGYRVTPWQPAEREPCIVRLEPAASLAGLVVGTDGRPAAWAALRLHLPGRPDPLLSSFSGPDGHFLLGGVPPALRTELYGVAEHGARGVLPLAPLQPHDKRSGLRLILSSSTVVRGRVVDANSRPVSAALLRLSAEESAGAHPSLAPAGSAGVHEMRSGTDGRFEILVFTPGHFRLDIERAGFVPRSLPDLPLTVPGHLDLGNLPLVTGLTLAGVVMDEEGAAVSGADVEVRAPSVARPWRAISGAHGRFTVPDLSPGELFAVTVRHPNYVTARLNDVQPAGAPLEVVLRTGAVLAGRVVDTAGKAVPEALVNVAVVVDSAQTSALGPEPGADQQATDSAGRFTFRGLPAGTATLRAFASGYRAAEKTNLEVRAGEPRQGVELVLEPGAVLAGAVRAPDGTAASGARVTLTRTAGANAGGRTTVATTLADAGGSFRLEGLEPEPLEVVAEHPLYRRTVQRTALTGGVNSIELVLREGLSIAGSVVDERGAPLKGAELIAEETGASAAHAAHSGADGSFRLSGLQPGPVELSVRASGFVPARRSVELDDASVAGLEVMLADGGAVHGRLLGIGAAELGHLEIAAFTPEKGTVSGRVSGLDYRIEGLAPGDWTVVASIAPGARQARATAHVEPEGEAEVDLDFGDDLVLAGHVRMNGRPLAGAPIELLGLAGQGAATSITGGAGEFEFSGVAAGPYSLRVRERASGLAHAETLELTESRRLDVDLVTARISGQVLAAEGTAPLAGASVFLQPLTGTGERLGTRTDSFGAFSFSRVPAGKYLLAVQVKERVALERRLAVEGGADQDLLLALNRGGY